MFQPFAMFIQHRKLLEAIDLVSIVSPGLSRTFFLALVN